MYTVTTGLRYRGLLYSVLQCYCVLQCVTVLQWRENSHRRLFVRLTGCLSSPTVLQLLYYRRLAGVTVLQCGTVCHCITGDLPVSPLVFLLCRQQVTTLAQVNSTQVTILAQVNYPGPGIYPGPGKLKFTWAQGFRLKFIIDKAFASRKV